MTIRSTFDFDLNSFLAAKNIVNFPRDRLCGRLLEITVQPSARAASPAENFSLVSNECVVPDKVRAASAAPDPD